MTDTIPTLVEILRDWDDMAADELFEGPDKWARLLAKYLEGCGVVVRPLSQWALWHKGNHWLICHAIDGDDCMAVSPELAQRISEMTGGRLSPKGTSAPRMEDAPHER